MSVQEDLLTGKPKQVEVSYREIAKALDKSIQRIEDCYGNFISNSSNAADIYNIYLYLVGGSMLRGLDKRISQKQTYHIAEDPTSGSSRNRYGA
jgi:rod shape-determining protein MreB